MNAVDTNVFVYALDADEPVKQAMARELFQRLTAIVDPEGILHSLPAVA